MAHKQHRNFGTVTHAEDSPASMSTSPTALQSSFSSLKAMTSDTGNDVSRASSENEIIAESEPPRVSRASIHVAIPSTSWNTHPLSSSDKYTVTLDPPSQYFGIGSLSIHLHLPDGRSQSTEPRVAVATVATSPRVSSGKKPRVDLTATTMERNFITVQRALSEFCLEPEHLVGLKPTIRRSPFDESQELIVLQRKDVVERATEVWGTPERLRRATTARQQERTGENAALGFRRQPRHMRKRFVSSTEEDERRHLGICGESGLVVILAIGLNGCNMVMKFVAWNATKSHSMFSEFLHSMADVLNQVIVAIGICTSVLSPNIHHPYGFNNMKFVTALIAGVAIFCIGTGLAVQHGINGLLHPYEMGDLTWAFVVLGVSSGTELFTLAFAVRALLRSAKQRNMSFMNYIISSQDPSVNIVLVEDTAAVISLMVAGGCLGISAMTESSIADAVGSLLVGLLLGYMAGFAIYTNVRSLLGRSIPQDQLYMINTALEADVMVRAIHDVKGIDIGNFMIRYKAELDFDGRQLTRAYLDVVDMDQLLESVKRIENLDDLENFMMEHGEKIVDMIGGQIDRIERKLKVAFPYLRHCDLEIL